MAQMTLFAGQQGRRRHDKTYGAGEGWGKERVGPVENRESSVETCTLPYVKQTASGNSLYDSGNSNPGSGTT